MDPVRAERLAWATVFAAVVALVVAYGLAPEGIGTARVALAAFVFAAVAPLAARLSRVGASRSVEPGDLTLRYVAFFAVAAAGQFGLAAVGYEGLGPRMAAFAAAWLVASRAERLNPKRWQGGPAA
jgi:lysylphosphatidylglycerol synthetase-like protein (DUF2156 family)